MSELKELRRLPVGHVIDSRWEIQLRLGYGGYGVVYMAKNHQRGLKAAVKMTKSDLVDIASALKMEAEVLRRLQGQPHICRLYGYGVLEAEKVAYVAMELLGPSLSDLQEGHKKLGVSTGVRIGRQCLAAIQSLHAAGFLHRDVKPDNFALGLEAKSRQIFIVDFGLARSYVKSNRIRPIRPEGRFVGTDDYASVRAHLRKDLGRCDDLWGFLYLLVEMVSGPLPWMAKEDRNSVGVIKAQISPMELCARCPPEFLRIYTHLARLTPTDQPDYPLIDAQLAQIQRRRQILDSDPFVWETGKNDDDNEDSWEDVN